MLDEAASLLNYAFLVSEKYYSGRPGGQAGDLESKAISASNLKLNLTEAELGNHEYLYVYYIMFTFINIVQFFKCTNKLFP